jgi:23S rRNA (uracil1939-C5)-methyltransferase
VSRRRAPRRLDVVLESLGDELRGVGAAEGREVHVRGALPGERLSVEVVHRHRGRWYARPLEWHLRAPEQRAPVCPSFAACGGCAAQHVPQRMQLAWKEERLLDALAVAGLTPRRVRRAVTGPLLFYRRKARLGVRYLPSTDEVVVGFREAFTRKVARIDACPVLVEPFASSIRALRDLVAALSVRAAVPQIEVAAGDDRAVVIIRHLSPLSGSDIDALRRFERNQGIDVLCQAAGYDSIVTIDGAPPPMLHYTLPRHGLALEFTPADFVQVNAAVNADLVDAAVAALALRPGDRVLDLFCGLGNFTLPIARTGARTTGVEASPALVARARHNAHRNGLDGRAAFRVADLYHREELDALADVARASNKALIDPPRSGAGPSLALLGAAAFERVAYVSCHPESFVKDAAALVAAGYELSEVGIFDMFPHTAHVETLGLFACR